MIHLKELDALRWGFKKIITEFSRFVRLAGIDLYAGYE
jgi:hypothetical protein